MSIGYFTVFVARIYITCPHLLMEKRDSAFEIAESAHETWDTSSSTNNIQITTIHKVKNMITKSQKSQLAE